MKKILAILVSSILICGCALTFACEEKHPEEGAMSFRAVEEGGKITGYAVQGMGDYRGKELNIPAIYNGLPVTEIDENAFDGCDITSVSIPDTVKTIGENAFARCENLKKVNIESVESWCNIDFKSMASCPMYFATELYLKGELLKNLIIPDAVTAIPAFAFYECSNITVATVGAGVTEIGENAFYNCENLESISLNGAVEHMGELAFAHCQKLERVQINGGVKEIGYGAFYECYALKKAEIPSSVKTIGESAFSMCLGLEELILNEGLEYIGDCAFGGCNSLKQFIMPDSVTEIGFGILMFVGGYLFDGEIEYTQNVLEKIVMSDNITQITQFAFGGCSLSNIAIGRGVEVIDYAAFYGCEWLESVIISNSVKQIVSYAFYHCYMLETVYYEGTSKEWEEISIAKSGNDITAAELYFYSESAPAGDGNYWHYSSDGVTPEKW